MFMDCAQGRRMLARRMHRKLRFLFGLAQRCEERRRQPAGPGWSVQRVRRGKLLPQLCAVSRRRREEDRMRIRGSWSGINEVSV